MESILFVVLVMGCRSVVTEDHKVMGTDVKEVINDVPFDKNLPKMEKIDVIKAKMADSSDDFIDGNHPDTGVVMTHEHVDQIVGHIPSTKRVKKILPPFEDPRSVSVSEVTIFKAKGTHATGDIQKLEREQPKGINEKRTEGKPNVKLTGDDLTDLTEHSVATWKESDTEELHTESPEYVSSDVKAFRSRDGDPPMTTASPTSHKNEAKRTGGQKDSSASMEYELPYVEVDERKYESKEHRNDEPAMPAKSIWDLLKEREQYDIDISGMDEGGTNVGTNGSAVAQVTTFEPTSRSPVLMTNEKDSESESEDAKFAKESPRRGSFVREHEHFLLPAKGKLDVTKAAGTGGKKNVSEYFEKKSEIPEEILKVLKLAEARGRIESESPSVLKSGRDDGRESKVRRSRWYLLLLMGNSTIVKLRTKDFTKYLKLNLAARLSVEYDDVEVNRVILASPEILVNVSVFASYDDVTKESRVNFRGGPGDGGEISLYKLAKTNGTLLELSGEEYRVARFLTLEPVRAHAEAFRDDRPASMASGHEDLQFFVYTSIGSACACAAIITFFVTVNKCFQGVVGCSRPWIKLKSAAWKAQECEDFPKGERTGPISPAVIYSNTFNHIRSSWMNGVEAPSSDASCGPREAVISTTEKYSSIEMGPSRDRRRSTSIAAEFEIASRASRRHSKLQMFHCDANSLVIPMPSQIESPRKGKLTEDQRTRTHSLLDVRITGRDTDVDNAKAIHPSDTAGLARPRGAKGHRERSPARVSRRPRRRTTLRTVIINDPDPCGRRRHCRFLSAKINVNLHRTG